MTLRAPCAFCELPRQSVHYCVTKDLSRRPCPTTSILSRNQLNAHFSPEDSMLVYPALSLEMSEKTPEFEPILNVPALGSFLLIFAIFSFLVQRTSAIEKAADDRTRAVETVRKLRLQALSGDATQEDVAGAIESYREAYEKVEKLRYVIPGLARITPPPAGSLSRKVMEENEMAARQFLGIEPDESSVEAESSENDSKAPGLSPVLVAVLAVVATSQIILLGLLSSDPMSTKDLLDVATIGLE